MNLLQIYINGVIIPTPLVVTVAVIAIILLALIIINIVNNKRSGAVNEIPDLDTRESFGDFHGLLTKEDFETPSDDPMVEIYRTQWIMAEPGDQKDNYLLLYLALKQLNKEQDESEDEWTQEQCEARMDEIINMLSEKTGIKLTEVEETTDDFDEYFEEEEKDEEDL
jgi:hypothetical protein